MEKTAQEKAAEQSAKADELLKITTRIVETTTTVETTITAKLDLDEIIERLKSENRADEKRIETKKMNLQAARSDKRDTRHLIDEKAQHEKTIAKLQARILQIEEILTTPQDDFSIVESYQLQIRGIAARIDLRNDELKKYTTLRDMQRLARNVKRIERVSK